MSKEKYIQNMALTATLFAAGRELMRENIRRRNPNASAMTVEGMLSAWMRRDHDPIPGDTIGIVRNRVRLP